MGTTSSALFAWRHSALLQSAAKLLTGRVAAMAMATASAPIIARLFDPSSYGEAAIFLAIITVASALLTGGYPRSVLFPPEDATAASLFTGTLVLSVIVTVSLYAGLAIAIAISPDLPSDVGVTSAVFWLIPVGALLVAGRDTFYVLQLRRSRFSAMAFMDFGQSGTVVGSRIAWGLSLGSSGLGLVLGHLAGLVAAVGLAWKDSKQWLASAASDLTWQNLLTVAKHHQDYPKYRLPAHLVFSLAGQVPVLALSFLYPPAVVGLYAMAYRVAGLPLQATSQALNDALLRKATGQRHLAQPIGPAIWKAALALLVTGIPIFTVMHLWGGEILGFVLGSQWYEAGEMLEILAVYLGFTWVSTAFSPTLDSLRRNRVQLVLQGSSLVLRSSAFVVAYLLGLDVYATLWLFVALACTQQVLVAAVGAWAVHQHDVKLRAG